MITFQPVPQPSSHPPPIDEVRNASADGGCLDGNGTSRSAGAAQAFVADRIETPLGTMLAAASDEGLVLLEFLDRPSQETDLVRIAASRGMTLVPGANRHLEQTKRQLADYFAGTRRDFTVALAPRGTPFQRRVWNQLIAIPFGETASYRAVAERIGKPGASRAVGQANGRNPIAVIVPCHRVIREGGSLCGYGGGTWRKQWLLVHERTCSGAASDPTSLFTRATA